MGTSDDILNQISAEEARLAALREEADAATGRIRELRERLARRERAAAGKTPALPFAGKSAVPASQDEKVGLFRSLFRGREDVFPRLWESSKSGKKGYSPTCDNEWVRGLCLKPQVKCGDCPNQAFTPISDEVIRAHLVGKHVMGLYPLLQDETCFFLAADFDKKSWQDDVGTYVETCRSFGVEPAVERSRSGNGAHVWFFFEFPVSAASARRMGCFFLTEAMANRHQLGLDSYDRFFPNQDTLPAGGFGNLIALPLQRTPREQGNSLFVDGAFEAFPDQWQYLSSIDPLSLAMVESLSNEASRRGQVIGVRIAPTDEDARTPWNRLPSGRSRVAPTSTPLPPTVKGVLSQRLFMEKEGLPSPVLNQPKRIAAFQNPEFYKKQNLRLSTALTPRVIACALDHEHHVSVPRGCADEVAELLEEYGSKLYADDERCGGEATDYVFQGKLTAVQETAVADILSHDDGLFVAPPGVGKTVVGTYLIAARGRSTLIMVHRKPLLEQWVAQLSIFLGIPEKEVGIIGGGKNKPNGRLDVAMIQSLNRKGAVKDIVATYGHVILDECHHLPAVTFEQVLSECKAKYVIGLTATPYRRDGHQPIIHMQCGPVRHAIDARSQLAKRPFEHELVCRHTAFHIARDTDTPIQSIYAAMVVDERRNQMLLDDIIVALEEGRSPIVLTERKDHLHFLAESLARVARNLVVLHGGMKVKERRETLARLSTIPDNEERLLLATGRYIGEGFDDARLDTLFLAMPVSWKGTLVQYTGRLHRLHPEKTEVRIYDYVDSEVPMLARMFERRLRGYRAIGYEPKTESLDLPNPVDEAIVEYDEEGR